MTLAEFLKVGVAQGCVISGTDTYLYHKQKPTPLWTSLWNTIASPIQSILPLNTLTTVDFWISGQGVQSILHYDTSKDHNLNFQVLGQKQVILFPP